MTRQTKKNPGDTKPNIDLDVVAGFGDEWTRFDQSGLSDLDQKAVFEAYFAIFPWSMLKPGSEGFDLGCGSGRWAALIAPRVGTLHCIDASIDALSVAKRNLEEQRNCQFHHASVDAIPLADGSADFGFSLGVLHHVPDTADAIRSCAAKLRTGAPFLVYLYYSFDNQPGWYRGIWKSTELIRFLLSRSPSIVRFWASQIIASVIYYPLARTAFLLEKLGVNVKAFPLSIYRHREFYVMRTDALDRFGTRLEQRFSRAQIEVMMKDAGLVEIRFSDKAPYWVAVGIKS